MKRIISLLALTLLLGCKTGKLEQGGAYSPTTTNSAGEIVAGRPDYAFFAVDLSFTTVYATVDAAFAFEKNNRDVLWKLSPEIKRTLDSIRPKAWDVVVRYGKARTAYLASPSVAKLGILQTTLADIQRLSTAATAALPPSR